MVSVLQVCAVLAQTYNPLAHTSHQHLMGRLLHALQVNGASRSALKDTRACPDVDHDGQAVRWYLFTLIAHSPQLLPTGHVAASELSCARRWELEPWGHVAVPEPSCARRRELGSQSTWRSRSCHGPWWRELEP
jgi:hypothetical protein